MPSPKSKREDDLNQLSLALYTPITVEARGDGTFLVKQGKPVARLTPEEFAGRVGLTRSTIYRYRGSEALPERFIEFCGVRKFTISAEAVDHFLKHWKAVRSDGSAISK